MSAFTGGPFGISKQPSRVGQELIRRHPAIPQDHREAALVVNAVHDTHTVTLLPDRARRVTSSRTLGLYSRPACGRDRSQVPR